MKKSTILVLGLVSLIIGVILSFNRQSFIEFLVSSLIYVILIFIILFLFIKTIINFINKRIKRGFLFLFLSIVLIVIVIMIFSFSYQLCNNAELLNHFRTNIFTGECEFAGYSSCSNFGDEWYYKQGCKLSEDKLKEIVKNTRVKDSAIYLCNQRCLTQKEVNHSYFCTEKSILTATSTSATLRCDFIVDCPTIKCP